MFLEHCLKADLLTSDLNALTKMALRCVIRESVSCNSKCYERWTTLLPNINQAMDESLRSLACYVMLCYVMLFHVMLFHVMLFYVMLR